MAAIIGGEALLCEMKIYFECSSDCSYLLIINFHKIID